jgi:alkaline phosphatase D
MLIRTPVTRRGFLAGAAAAAAAWPALVSAQRLESSGRTLFRHGVASGDPLADRVMLWTRVMPPESRSATGAIEVRWELALDEGMTQIAASGVVQAAPERDFTVKVDAAGLQPGRTYYFAFDAGGERSPVGRTKTLPASADRLRLAVVSCANYPAGFFNVYRCVANRDDLDAVLHLGDYMYEFANGIYGDGSALGRVAQPPGEAVTLEEYRLRYACYRSDTDLQAAHQRHPFITVWDDHEVANNMWSGGAEDHVARKGEWTVRLAAAYRAYLEWMPIRESPQPGPHLNRAFRFGTLADLLMLDTRSRRDRQAAPADVERLVDPRRSMLGEAQEAWLFDELRASQRAGTPWRLIGQQVMFAQVTPPGLPVQNVDAWDGYPAARRRVFDFLAGEQVRDVAILTGDIHSSWANDLPRDVILGYKATTGAGSMAVEVVTPAISSPPLFSIAGVRERAPLLRLAMPHIKYLEGDSRGYVHVDLTRERLTAEWHFVPSVTERSDRELRGGSYVCERGSSRLVPA